MNHLTYRDYQEEKNKSYTVVYFEGQKRIGTHSGLSLRGVKDVLIQQTKAGLVCLVFEENDNNYTCGSAWDLKDYLSKRGGK